MSEIIEFLLRVTIRSVMFSDIPLMAWSVIMDIFSVVASLATAAAVIVAVYTLREIQKQRQAIYQPEIILTTTPFYCYTNQKNWSFLSSDMMWTTKKTNHNKQKETNIDHKNSFRINLYNIGLGAAKNIQIKYVTSLTNYITLIKQLNRNNEVKIEYQKDILNIDFEEKSFNMIFMIENNLKKDVDYVLPTNVDNQPFKLELSSMYLTLYSIIYFLYHKRLFEEKDSDLLDAILDSIPKLQLTISYKDIGNKLHNKLFTLTFKVFSFSSEQWNGCIEVNTKSVV